MNYPDKYQLNNNEEKFLLKKNLVNLIYNTGKFEALNTTLFQTEEIVKYNRANQVEASDVVTILNLKKGYQLLLDSKGQSAFEFAQVVNSIVAHEDALFPGKIRTGLVEVPTAHGVHQPPIPEITQEERYFQNLEKSDLTATEKALEIFLHIARWQIFWDGNKRSAIITANKFLFDTGAGIMSIPELHFSEFNQLLGQFYLFPTNYHQKIKDFLYQETIFGIDYQN